MTIERVFMALGSGLRAQGAEILLYFAQILRCVDANRLHRILGGKRNDWFGSRKPRNEGKKIALAGRAADFDLIGVSREPIQIGCPRQREQAHVALPHLW